MSDDGCPVCGGPLQDPAPITVCGGCARIVERSGAISVTSTAEFAAVSPAQAAAILEGGPAARPRPDGASCTWCGKLQGQVKQLLSGGGVHICNECVALCSDILTAELGDDWR